MAESVHLVTRPNARHVKAACGLDSPRRYTSTRPEAVTCGWCRKALAMADLEIAARQSGRR